MRRAPSLFHFESDESQKDSSEELEVNRFHEEQSAVFQENSDSGESISESDLDEDITLHTVRAVSGGSLKSMVLERESSKMLDASPIFAYSPPGSKKYDEETVQGHVRLGRTL
jgi:hypothetical protein